MLELDQIEIEQDGFRLCADLAVPRGQKTAVIGPSGAGKSTLLSAIAGFIAPCAGRILWEGRDITGLPPGQRPMSILFQDQNLFPHLSVARNVALGLRPDLKLSRLEWDRVDEALRRVGLTGLQDRKPGTLSGGQQSRVALARALIQARPLMLLDEPFSALGPALKTEMLDLVAGIADETEASVLMVSHDPADALRFASHTILVADGRALPPRDTGELLNDPPPALAAYLGK
ncbi:thiamine transport system ATP-binding protein [Albidovulum inexpectatum]|uniref:Thiamine transport system ATP-binding protein n=1 Tax=Albidovulum inexpectatum TaxID=196587 RepID=A0A2S5JM77_9RHOB|nr:thiamine ABC transporter ATP-binding protein [Albidovulum inexpectatum]PPB82501.1 thiamine transport system ATP-binding protein [Albidovulum inexpectatum]